MKARMNVRPSVSGTKTQWKAAVRANCARDQSTKDKSMVSIIKRNLFGELFNYIIGTFRIIVKICFQKIWKKEYLQDGKHNKKLDTDDHPKRFSNSHAAETLNIKPEYFVWQTRNHNLFKFRSKI
jgi:hypothetical protein